MKQKKIGMNCDLYYKVKSKAEKWREWRAVANQPWTANIIERIL